MHSPQITNCIGCVLLNISIDCNQPKWRKQRRLPAGFWCGVCLLLSPSLLIETPELHTGATQICIVLALGCRGMMYIVTLAASGHVAYNVAPKVDLDL